MMEGVVFGCEGRESEGGTKGKVDEACGGDGDGKAVGNAGSCGGIRDGMIVVAGRTAAESVGAPGICRSTRIAPLIWMPEKDNNCTIEIYYKITSNSQDCPDLTADRNNRRNYQLCRCYSSFAAVSAVSPSIFSSTCVALCALICTTTGTIGKKGDFAAILERRTVN
ncbi:hypothetical protein DM860_009498 [Cuscuta australis]|uniref:Uncharacterized protein n=1 Tax=Cuscuta australis TaxID=267555 RepID=A0A328DJF1_9ASTE|nr:hypothetical protein DM860_009498 [Cuscuta australis]